MLTNIVMFSPQNVTFYAWIPLIVIWAVLVVIMIADIVSTSKSRTGTLLWTLTVLLLPAISGVLYAVRCLVNSAQKCLVADRK